MVDFLQMSDDPLELVAVFHRGKRYNSLEEALDDNPLVVCSLHQDYVAESEVITLHGGRGREAKVVCLSCIFDSAQAWHETGCPFCVSTAERVLGAIDVYIATGEPFTLPEVPSDELVAHSKDCRWVDDVFEGQPRV